MSINWVQVALRLVDGFLYGTGFCTAVFFWALIVKVVPKL